MWVLPKSDDNYSALELISREIEENNGEALLMQSVFFYPEHEERIKSYFNNLRDEEYKELIGECEKYLNELKKEITIQKFTFAELEEEEEELEKLISWHGKIKARDIFKSSQGDYAEEKLDEIKNAFENYSNMVYSHNNK
jgi:vacuolar-type H+-ATPase subunit I/STV1